MVDVKLSNAVMKILKSKLECILCWKFSDATGHPKNDFRKYLPILHVIEGN